MTLFVSPLCYNIKPEVIDMWIKFYLIREKTITKSPNLLNIIDEYVLIMDEDENFN